MIHSEPLEPIRNGILSSLSATLVARLRPSMERVALPPESVLHEAGSTVDSLYFVESGFVSITVGCEGANVQAAIIGREGLVGIAALLDRERRAPNRASNRVPVIAWRIRAEALAPIFGSEPALRTATYRFMQFLLAQMEQSVACNGRHSLAERCARWLLTCSDRMDGEPLPLTQDFLASSLGVRRAGVSVAANALQESGLIRYTRGRIRIQDREGLKARSCSCYETLEADRLRTFGVTPARAAE